MTFPKVKVAILGGSGYTAVELMKLLLRHPHAEIVAVTSRQEPGKPVSADHPILFGRLDLPLENFDPDKLKAKGVTCVFGCLPHGASAEAVAPLLERGMRVVDLSADYRLKDPAEYQEWYGQPHPDELNLEHAVYGLPEFFRDEIRTAKLVANPGCYPQTAILGLAPLIRGDLIDRDTIIIDSKSGISGAGRTPKLATLYPECNENFSAYSVGVHRHTPEIEQELGVDVTFTAHLVPVDRGLLATCYARLIDGPMHADDLRQRYVDFYAEHPFVEVVGSPPGMRAVQHTNYAQICPVIDPRGGRVTVFAVIDNIGKGAAGQALQNLNLMAGRPEDEGLR